MSRKPQCFLPSNVRSNIVEDIAHKNKNIEITFSRFASNTCYLMTEEPDFAIIANYKNAFVLTDRHAGYALRHFHHNWDKFEKHYTPLANLITPTAIETLVSLEENDLFTWSVSPTAVSMDEEIYCRFHTIVEYEDAAMLIIAGKARAV